MTFARVLVAFGSATLAGCLALGAVLVHGGVLGAFGRAGAADVGAQGAEVAWWGEPRESALRVAAQMSAQSRLIGMQLVLPSRTSPATQAWQARRHSAQASIQACILLISESAMLISLLCW